jgi:hypothetical protein
VELPTTTTQLDTGDLWSSDAPVTTGVTGRAGDFVE